HVAVVRAFVLLGLLVVVLCGSLALQSSDRRSRRRGDRRRERILRARRGPAFHLGLGALHEIGCAHAAQESPHSACPIFPCLLDMPTCIRYSVCMQKRTQYTIRNVPDWVDRSLRRRAKETGESFNQVALDALAAGIGERSRPKRDLAEVVGSLSRQEAE